jgi:RHS repeat-associated protein
LNRLIAATWSGYGAKSYAYDQVGNVLTNGETGNGAYSYGTNGIRPHCVRTANGMWFTYDQNGNVVFRTGQRLDYDVNNRLYRAINTNGTTTFFGYDANGERLWEQSGTNALQVWIDGNYEEKQGDILYHIYAGGKLVATFDKTKTNVFQYYHPDDLTSTSIQTDTNGAPVQNYEYSAFGQSRYTQNTNLFKVSRRYTGQILDDNTGLYYYNARYYDPMLGRFTQADSAIPNIFNPQSYNRYSYCVNNPLRYTDPTGHDPAFSSVGMFQSLTVEQEVTASKAGAPVAMGVLAAMITGGAAAPALVSAGASTTFAAVGSGIVAGAAGDLASQGTQIGLGQRSSISGQEVAVSSLIGGALSGGASKIASLKSAPEAPESGPTEAYNRKLHYGNTPTKTDRTALGANANEVVDHNPPLVKRYYEGDPASGEKPGYQMTPPERQASANDRSRMQLQPKPDSNKQGAEMSRYSKQKKQENGLQ